MKLTSKRGNLARRFQSRLIFVADFSVGAFLHREGSLVIARDGDPLFSTKFQVG